MSGQEALLQFLQKSITKKCVVELSTGSRLTGTLCTIDKLFNIVMKDVTETLFDHQIDSYPSIYLRGNNVVHVSPIPE